MNDIFISKKVLENEALTDNGFLVYVALRAKWCYSPSGFNKDIIHVKDLYWILTGKLGCSNSYVGKLHQGIENLSLLGLIDYQRTDINSYIATFKEAYFFSAKKEAPNFEEYVCIRLEEIQIIMASDEKYRDKLLRYFICKIGTVYHGENKRLTPESPGFVFMDNVGNMPIKYSASLAGIGEKAAIAYDRWFEDNNLLIILRSSNKVIDEHTLKIMYGFTNCYARPEHFDILKYYYDQREDLVSNTNIIKISKESNRNRSNKMTYNAYKKGLRHDKQKLLEALTERIENYRKIKKSMHKRKSPGSTNGYEIDLEIEELERAISEVCWEGFLNGKIELQFAS